MLRLAIITTHPIQYYAPVFELLHTRKRIAVKVFYTWGEAALNSYDQGFGKVVQWDLPLLSGYPYEWALNQATDPGSHHFKGIDTPHLHRQVMNWKPDAVLIMGWAYRSHLSALRYFYNKVPVFFRGDSTLLDEQTGIKSALKRIALRWVYSHINCAFYNGTHNKAYFKAYGVAENKLIFAPHAIDNDRFSASRPQEAALLRQQLQIKEEDILLLFAGKFEEKKNPLLLLHAFKKLTTPGLHLLFTGNGMLENELKKQAAQQHNIHFMDFQNQSAMPAVYQAADLFCLPSAGPGESWGLAVNEAMAAGKPVLVSDKVGCAADLVQNGHNGAIFKSSSTEALLNALNRLMQNKKNLIRMGRQSLEMIQPWSFTSVATALENAVLNYK
jgi:glycosyltransferase involved in cell wall biosynthesis